MRTSVFVDGSNLYYTQKKLGFHIDGRLLLEELGRGNELVEAYWYQGLDEDDDSAFRFLEAMSYVGYIIRSKPIKRIVREETGEVVYRANLDVEMIIDIFNTMPLYDQCFLVTGDGDFVRVVEILRTRGKVVHVFSTQGMVSRELRMSVGFNYHDLAEMRDRIEKRIA